MKVIAKQNRKLVMINAQNTQNENDAEKIILQVPEKYEDFVKKIAFITPDGVKWDVIENNEYLIKKAITKYEQVQFYIWLTKDDVDFRTEAQTLKFNVNHEVEGEVTPEEQTDMERVIFILDGEIIKVNNKEQELNDLISEIQTKLDNGEFNGKDGKDGQNGLDGQPGVDGISPTITERQTTNGYDITITDKNGSNTISLVNGKDGTNGKDGAKGDKGEQGEQGDDYVLTQQDKQEIAELVDIPVDDVQINGTSIVQNGVANVPIASPNTLGTVKIGRESGIFGIRMVGLPGYEGEICVNKADVSTSKAGRSEYKPITPSSQHAAAFYGLAKAAGDTSQSQSSNEVGNYTEDAKSAISEMLGGSVSVSGTTPTIVAKSGIRYVCGEVATLDFTPSEKGICDVVFTSGATATVLTVPSTVKWANGFDPTALDANTTYELNIIDGLGVACAWT